MTDSTLLNEEIVDSGITITAIARKLGITREGLYKKINNETEFKASEILSMQKILNLTNKKRDSIFFANKVEQNSTKQNDLTNL
ncbi:toxin-antitoxin system, antitoxin component, Xre family protein [Roseburia sp. AF34-16]|uniref:helix-turn-helix domain-containing protein n=1 Tax=Roseburia sp. AF34-16 TaxID=2293136 RepID=UPI000E52936A|nr:helix-turn-helix domain-containing protein [Roseburia sp. AF34-16]RGF60606.1 toxin-antitoxin system, antitoxin component, Xre family protein [Roseburia sp. AF34-16]